MLKPVSLCQMLMRDSADISTSVSRTTWLRLFGVVSVVYEALGSFGCALEVGVTIVRQGAGEC